MRLINLLEDLSNRVKYDENCEIHLHNHHVDWKLYIVNNRLLYAADRAYPIRRWDRALNQQGCTWNWSLQAAQLARSIAWECQLLEQGIRQKQLSFIRAKLIIRTIVQECFFKLASCSDFDQTIQTIPIKIDSSYQIIALSALELQAILRQVLTQQHRWQDAGLSHLSPNLSPTLKSTANLSASSLSATRNSEGIPPLYLNGQFMIWDIAHKVEQSLITVTDRLLPLIEQNLLQFKEIVDSPVPLIENSRVTPIHIDSDFKALLQQSIDFGETSAKVDRHAQSDAFSLTRELPIIACIDDSPVLSHTLNKVLTEAGYRTLSIQEPMRGFTQLIEHKPDLILLDLMLPNADGYSICRFLRNTPVFQKTPIIILTAQNTAIDRACAKAAGATAFLSKPPQPEELLHLIKEYLH